MYMDDIKKKRLPDAKGFWFRYEIERVYRKIMADYYTNNWQEIDTITVKMQISSKEQRDKRLSALKEYRKKVWEARNEWDDSMGSKRKFRRTFYDLFNTEYHDLTSAYDFELIMSISAGRSFSKKDRALNNPRLTVMFHGWIPDGETYDERYYDLELPRNENDLPMDLAEILEYLEKEEEDGCYLIGEPEDTRFYLETTTEYKSYDHMYDMSDGWQPEGPEYCTDDEREVYFPNY